MHPVRSRTSYSGGDRGNTIQVHRTVYSNYGKVLEKTTSTKSKPVPYAYRPSSQDTYPKKKKKKKQKKQKQSTANKPITTGHNPAPGSTTDICQETLFANMQKIHVSTSYITEEIRFGWWVVWLFRALS